MDIHPLCLVLPEMTAAEYAGLLADVKAKGLLYPITTYEGKVLDGRHRLRACREAGIVPRFKAYEGADPAGFVASTCQHRSLNASQRALIAAGFLAYEQEKAKRRQLAAQNNNAAKAVQENFPELGQARDKAGERMQVSGRTVDEAAKVLAHAAPEVVQKVRSGDMALNEAKKVVQLNPEAQRRVADAPTKQARREALREAVNRSESAKRRKDRAVPPIISEPSTPFVRKMLSAVERIAIMCAEDGMKEPRVIADKFLAEMDWTADALAIQFERCEPVIRALILIREHRVRQVKAA